MSLTGISANRLELLALADALAREKAIEKEIVVQAIEEAIQKAARARYGAEHDITASIDVKTGELILKRRVTVVDDDADFSESETPDAYLRLSDAKRTDKQAVVGKVYEEVLPPFDFGRVQTQMARQVVTHKVREAERERQFEEFKDRVGEIVNGVAKRVEYGNVIVDLGRGEGVMRRDQSIPREVFNVGDRIRCYIYDVRPEAKGPQIMLSRAHGGFMAKLFAQEVPEVYDGVIEIRAVARDPGSRAKMAVVSNDSSIDPVGACVGMRGSRVQAVVAELQGEKIDIITEQQDSERRQQQFAERTQLFQESLDVDEVIAQLLVTEGFATVDEVAYVDPGEIAQIEGFDEDTAEEIQARARDFLEREAAEYDAKRKELGVDDALLEVEGVTLPISVALGQGGVKTVEDLAGLVPDDLRGWFESKNGERVREPGVLETFNLSPDDAEALIMRARVAMGWIEPEPEPEPEPEGEEQPEAEGDEAAEGQTLEAATDEAPQAAADETAEAEA